MKNNLNYIKSNKFKSNSMLLAIPFDVNEDITSLNILCQVLKRGTKKFPSSKLINRELQDMYGASIEMAVSKRADKTLLIFYITYLKERFTFEKVNNFERAVNLLSELIYHPLMNDGFLDKEIVKKEIENHKQFLESEKDDKKVYCNYKAWEKLIGKPYSIPEYGLLSEIDDIDEKKLILFYNKLLKKTCRAYFFGDVNPNDYLELLEEKLPIINNGTFVEEVNSINNNDYISDYKEEDNVNQAKVTMLFNINSNIKDEKYYAGMIFNYLFGGGLEALFYLMK